MKNFVTARGQELYFKDNKFRSIGVNRYNLLTRNINGKKTGCANQFSEKDIENMFYELHEMGVTSVRFWLFQSFTKSGEDMSRFDFVIKTADSYGIKLIPVFENHWQDCTEGGVKTSSWYESGYRSPYGKYSLSLKDYIGKIVPWYKNNTTIMMWEILNESRDVDPKILYNFATDISSYIKLIDPNHLVNLGMMGEGYSALEYEIISTINTVDVLDYHDYYEDSKPMPGALEGIFNETKKVNKPLIVSESGIKETVPDRAGLFDAKINAFFIKGGSVYMIWSYGQSYVTNDGYIFGSSDPVAKVIRKAADAL